jgi:predicted ester cyclase
MTQRQTKRVHPRQHPPLRLQRATSRTIIHKRKRTKLHAKDFLNSIARGDVVGMQTFAHENCIVYFADDVELIISDMVEEVVKCYESFPDQVFNYLEARVVEPDVVVIKYQWTGTHTGKPFAFGPYDPIPAKGTVVAVDPERCTITLRDGLIVKCRVDPEGPNTGWHGVYREIGGLIM